MHFLKTKYRILKNEKIVTYFVLFLFLFVIFTRTAIEKFRNFYFTSDNSLRMGGCFKKEAGLNPFFTGDLENIIPIQFIFSSLVQINSNGQIVRDVAEDFETGQDFKSITFHIKNNVRFHDGSLLTSEDILWTFDQLKNPKVTPYSIYYSFIEKAKIIDDYTLVFHFKKTMPAPEYYFSFKILSSDSKATCPNIGFPVGSGPYIFLSIDEQGNIFTKKNEFYYGEPGNPDFITFKNYSNKESFWSGFMRDEIDIFQRLSPSQHQMVKNEDWCNIKTAPALDHSILLLNKHHPFLKKNQIRKAIDLAIDRKEIMEKVFHLKNVSLPFHDTSFNQTLYQVPYAPNQSLQILKQNGFVMDKNGVFKKDGIPLSLTLCIYDYEQLKIAKIIKLQLKKIGIQIQIKIIFNSQEYNQKVFNKTDFDIGLITKHFSLKETSLVYWLKGMGIKPFILENDDFSELYWQMIKAKENKKKIHYYKKLLQMIANEKTCLFLAHPYVTHAFHKRLDISGTDFAPYYLISDFKKISIKRRSQ